MRQDLVDHWTLDIDPSFTRRDDEDGYTFFESPEMSISSLVFIEQPLDPAEALLIHDWDRNPHPEYPWHFADRRTAGHAREHKELGGLTLSAMTASCGHIVRIGFSLRDEALLNQALEIWRSLRFSPPEWVHMCVDADPPLRELRGALERGTRFDGVISEISAHGQQREATAVLLKALGTDSAAVRTSACQLAELMGDADECLLVALRTRLDDSVVEVRASAASALLRFDESPEAIVQSMVDGLQKQEPPLPKGEDRIMGPCEYLAVPERYHAARILAELGAEARPAKDVLIRYQWDESGGVRLCIAEALMALDEPSSAIMPPLIDGLHNSELSDRERMRIAERLLHYGEPAENLLSEAIRAISESKDWSARFEALNLVSDMGRQAINAIGTIEKALREETDVGTMRIVAAGALLRIGAKSELACEVLLSAIEEERDGYELADILWYLGHYEGLDEPALVRVAQQLVNDHPAVQAAAAIVLARHGKDISAQVPSLFAALDADDERTLWGAVMALGEAGAAANSAVGRLLQLARGADCDDVRSAAAWALSRIAPEHPDVQSLPDERSQDTGPGVDG